MSDSVFITAAMLALLIPLAGRAEENWMKNIPPRELYGSHTDTVATYSQEKGHYIASVMREVGPYWSRYDLSVIEVENGIPLLKHLTIEEMDEKGVNTVPASVPAVTCSGHGYYYDSSRRLLHCLLHRDYETDIESVYALKSPEQEGPNIYSFVLTRVSERECSDHASLGSLRRTTYRNEMAEFDERRPAE